MKRLSLFILLFCASLMTMAQDVIVKKDGTTIQSKVMQANGSIVWYKEWLDQNGPVYTIDRSDIERIDYQQDDKQNASDFVKEGVLERKKNRLVLNGYALSDNEVLYLLGEDAYDSYLGARKQLEKGATFAGLFYGSVAVDVLSVIGATVSYSYGDKSKESLCILIGSLSAVVTGVMAPLMGVFNGIGKGRLDRLCEEYNRNKNKNISFNFSPSIIQTNALQSQGNIGLGMTFSMNF